MTESEISILNIILTALFSFFIALLTSEKAVERSQLRRYHSEKLKDSLIEWKSNIHLFLTFNSEYSHNDRQIEMKIIGDISTIPFYNFLWEHLEKGNKDIVDSWNHLYELFLKINNERADIINNIFIKLKEQNADRNSYFYYPKLYDKQPEEFINIIKMSEIIFEETQTRLRENVKWKGGEPNITKSHGREGILFHNLAMSSTSPSSQETCASLINYDEMVKIMKSVYDVLADEGINDSVRHFLTQFPSYYVHEIDFSNKLSNLIWYIELGNNLKGSCKFCPGQIYKTFF
jgi:hypothetical protein